MIKVPLLRVALLLQLDLTAATMMALRFQYRAKFAPSNPNTLTHYDIIVSS